MSDFVAANLVEKDNMKVDLSRADSDVVQYNFIRTEMVLGKVAQIVGKTISLNDSFYLNNTSNGVINVNVLGDRRTSVTSFSITVNI